MIRKERTPMQKLILVYRCVLLLSVIGCSPERDVESQLVVAARAKDLVTVRQLLDAGISANARETVEGEGRSAMYHAANVGATAIVQLLIARGANVNETVGGRPTPLMAAAVNGHADVVAALLDAGADVNAREAQTGATALTDAARNGHLEVVRILVKRSADLTATLKDGNTALSWSRSRGFSQIADVLIMAGATK
jgi:ankyrin repeat protein